MENEFVAIMAKKTDDYLIKLVTIERGDFAPSAIEAAEEELKKRNIDKNVIETVVAEHQSVIAEVTTIESLKAPLKDRFLNYVIDWFIFMLTIFVGFTLQDVTDSDLFMFFPLFTFTFCYIFMEYKFQQTIGKMFTKTKVVDLNGGKPALGRIIARNLGRFIPFNTLSFCFADGGFHDLVSGTRVIADSGEIHEPLSPKDILDWEQ